MEQRLRKKRMKLLVREKKTGAELVGKKTLLKAKIRKLERD
jgi:hypothetical protein